jgi:hypothetical protein
MNGAAYEILMLKCHSQKTPEQQKKETSSLFFEIMKSNSTNNAEKIWELLTSRGPDKLIHGPMPKNKQEVFEQIDK